MSIVVDTDFAGCRVARRRTSGGVALYGSHCVRHGSSTQTTIALSRGETELGCLCKGASHGTGLKSICTDLGLERSIHVFADATAAMKMCHRLEIGKIRHLDASLLWLQHKCRAGDVPISTAAGADNCADALTKHLNAPVLRSHLKRMALDFETGRAESAPQLQTVPAE